jgi:hypothetical protein
VQHLVLDQPLLALHARCQHDTVIGQKRDPENMPPRYECPAGPKDGKSPSNPAETPLVWRDLGLAVMAIPCCGLVSRVRSPWILGIESQPSS